MSSVLLKSASAGLRFTLWHCQVSDQEVKVSFHYEQMETKLLLSFIWYLKKSEHLDTKSVLYLLLCASESL